MGFTPTKRALLGIVSWNMIVAMDTTCLSVALPIMAEDLHATSNQVYWAGTSFVLCSAVFQPIFSSLATAFGRKPLLLLALTLFTAGAALCSIANDIAVLLVGRCLQGVGGGGMITLSYVVLVDLFSLEERARAQSVISLTWLFGTVIGPIMGGGFTENVTWRWIFWFNLPFCAIGFLTTLMIPFRFRPAKTPMEALKSTDWTGAFLFAGSVTTFLVGLSWGGGMFAWLSWQTILPLSLGAAGIAAWVAWSLFMTKNPMIELRILNNRTMSITYLGGVIHGMVQFGVLFYLPLYFQGAKGFKPLITGVALIPVCLGAAPSSVAVGLLIGKTRKIKPFIMGGWILYTGGMALFQLLNADTSNIIWILLVIPTALGLGTLFVALAMSSQTCAEQQFPPAQVEKIKTMVAGLNPFFRAIGQALGIVIGQAAFNNRIVSELGDKLGNEATGIVQTQTNLPHAEFVLLSTSIAHALKLVWWILLGVSAVGLVTAIFTSNLVIELPPAKDAESSPVRDMKETKQSPPMSPVSIMSDGKYAASVKSQF